MDELQSQLERKLLGSQAVSLPEESTTSPTASPSFPGGEWGADRSPVLATLKGAISRVQMSAEASRQWGSSRWRPFNIGRTNHRALIRHRFCGMAVIHSSSIAFR